MTFLFDANCYFEAESIDVAFSMLSEHFGYLQNPEDSGLIELQFVGHMELKEEK